MTPMSTYIDQAHTRARAEQNALDAKLDAIETFRSRVEDLPTEQAPNSSTLTATTGALSQTTASTETNCRRVRTAFAETIQPHTDETDSLLAALETVFSESIAGALAPTTETQFSPECKQMVLSAVRTRRTETETLENALEQERAHLTTASEHAEEIVSWIATAEETPLTELNFEQLQRRHETLQSHREQCNSVAHRRQAFLQETTNKKTECGVRHERLIPSLYEDFAVDHPVLATVTRLDGLCATCQRAVRTHLVRRV